jgi:colanic acid biosynthesis glycosyl transferase WcaI
MVTLLYSGNFGLGHDLDTILRAVHMLNGTRSPRVLLVGTGKRLSEIQRLVAELKLAGVEFRPPVSLHDLPALLAAGDIHIVAQKPHTQGLLVPSKIYGTLAVGRPTIFIGPDHCEVAQIVRESGSGFVIAPGDVESAAQALSRLAGDPELRRVMGERAKRYYAEKFGRKRSVARIVDVIQRVGGGQATSRTATRSDSENAGSLAAAGPVKIVAVSAKREESQQTADGQTVGGNAATVSQLDGPANSQSPMANS